MKKRIKWIALFSAMVLLFAGCANSTPSAAPESSDTAGAAAPASEPAQKTWQPDATLEFIAAGGPGGGYDILCRTMEQVLNKNKLVSQPIIITNKSGGGGSTGWAYLNSHKGGGNSLAAISALIVQNNLLGTSSQTYEDFTPLAMLQAEWEAIAVPKDSPYKTGKEFFDALKADPSKINIGVGPTLGNNDHIQFLTLAKAYGITDVSKIKFVVYPGAGGEEIPALLGNHVQALTISLGEVKEQYLGGNLNILGVSSDKRLEGDLGDIPTWKEQGVDLVFPQWRGVMGPGEMTPEQIAYWDDVLGKMAETKDWKDAMENQNMDLYYMNSADFKAYLEKATEEQSELLKSVGLIK